MAESSFVVHPATLAHFEDVRTMLGPKRPDATVCWCLSHRLDSRTNRLLIGPQRGNTSAGCAGARSSRGCWRGPPGCAVDQDSIRGRGAGLVGDLH